MSATPNLGLSKPPDGDTSWGTNYRNAMDSIDASFDPATGHAHDGTTPGSGPNLPTTAITGLAEFIRDTIGAALVAGTRVTVTVNDVGDTITISSDDASTAEFVRDTIGSALVAGSGASVTVNDGADTITIASTITQYTDEMVDDRVAVLLVAGAGVTLAYNDGANTLTVSANTTGLSWKAPVRAASTTNHTLTAPGATVDGVSLISGDRILLKNQTAPAENGIYIWNGASSTATRATDADIAAEILQAAVFTEEGTQADTLWVCTTDAPITLGSTSLTFVNIGSVSGGLLAVNNLSELTSMSTARTNLGLGTSAVKNIPASGDAAVGEVVYGTDTRLTNARTPSGHHASHESGGTDALTGVVPGSSFAPTGLTGATALSRYVGATTSGAPVSGTFNQGDFVISRDGGVYICTVAGTPGTWVAVTGGGGGSALTVEEADGSPTDSAVTKIVFPNGTLSFVGHVVTYTPSGSGGGGVLELGYVESIDTTTRTNSSLTLVDVNALSLTINCPATPITFELQIPIFMSSVAATRHDFALYDVTAGAAVAYEVVNPQQNDSVFRCVFRITPPAPGVRTYKVQTRMHDSGGTGLSYRAFGTSPIVPYSLRAVATGGNNGQSLTGGQLSEQVLSVAAASITIPLPAGYKDLEIDISARGTTAAVNTSYNQRINGDTGANYDSTQLLANNAGSTITPTRAGTSAGCGFMPAATAPANDFNSCRISLHDYESAQQKHISTLGGLKQGTGADTDLFQYRYENYWRSTAAITSITLIPAAGNFDIGTVVRVYARGVIIGQGVNNAANKLFLAGNFS